MSTLSARLRANAFTVDRYARGGAKLLAVAGALCLAFAFWAESFARSEAEPAPQWAREAVRSTAYIGQSRGPHHAAPLEAPAKRPAQPADADPLKIAGGVLLALAAGVYILDRQALRMAAQDR